MWEVVGLAEPEERVYEALIPLGSASATDLALRTGLSIDSTSRILTGLVGQGLASRLPGRPARFAAVRPDLAASTLIAAQESKLGLLREHAAQVAASLRAASNGGNGADLIEVVEGASNVRHAFMRLQLEARKEMRVFDKPPYTRDQPDGNVEEYRMLHEGRVGYRTVYDKAALTQEGRMAEIRRGIRHGERARVGTLPMKMAISDDRLALIPTLTADSAANRSAYVVHNSSLLDALAELFEIIWASAVPINQQSGREVGPETLTDEDRDLLGLLAAGSTDEMMARNFGWSPRTVQRHVRRIMNMLGVETRFQAGLEAGRRGWL